ncbi:MAG: hypothetical protein KGO52_12905 [Nitrospirota bacterium]|nr:hypothetical protein [Nitrospirota bacterium]
MKLYRSGRSRNQPMGDVEDWLQLMTETLPTDGHLVLTAWVSPVRLSEEDRIRLHHYLIDAHGAVSVLTIGLSKTDPGLPH